MAHIYVCVCVCVCVWRCSLLTAKMVDEVIVQVRGGLGVLHSLCDSIAMLDMV